MAGLIGCGGLILIVLFIVFLFVRKRKIDNKLKDFYKQSQLYRVNDYPPNIREALGGDNWICLKGSVVVEHKPFEFYWLESFSKSNLVMVNGVPTTTITPYLAIVFPPRIVSEEFMLKSFQSMESHSKFKDTFVPNTTTPIRVEKLADGSFLMVWQVLYQAEIYQQKLDWLEANLS